MNDIDSWYLAGHERRRKYAQERWPDIVVIELTSQLQKHCFNGSEDTTDHRGPASADFFFSRTNLVVLYWRFECIYL